MNSHLNISSTTLDRKKSSNSINSLNTYNTLATMDTSNTLTTISSSSNQSSLIISKKSSSNNMSNNNSSLHFTPPQYQSFYLNDPCINPDILLEEEEDYNLDLELYGPPWTKEGLLKIKRFEKPKFFSLYKYSKSSNDISSSYSNPNNPNRNRISSHKYNSVHHSFSNIKWKTNFSVVSRGELKLFSFDINGGSNGHNNNRHNNSTNHPHKLKKKLSRLRLTDKSEKHKNVDGEIGDGNWMKNANEAGSYSLYSTYAKIIPDGNISDQKFKTNELETFWALKLPSTNNQTNNCFNLTNSIVDGMKDPLLASHNLLTIYNENILIFSAGTKEIAEEYVFTCNFWAARLTAIPIESEAISNKEFGWGSILKENDITKILSTKIHKWEPMLQSLTQSNNTMKKQLVELYKYVQVLEDLIGDHIKIKTDIEKFFKEKFFSASSACNQRVENTSIYSTSSRSTTNTYSLHSTKLYKLIMVNWNNKYSYLINEHNQFKDYVLTLKEAIDIKDKEILKTSGRA
ncbi:uncharacterized protein ASCRUDRAFT_72854 [Ascoidea rubescens DSM 1968]|uniref:Uncharacterized protein n=1 Tax=Ascoidea rubescens DSM 1968 TaxID=1344418 RepID=A0A1D2V983_9ASCO|nr:hypothetical protein ASCRUDRAFT_72854 [Ascoidea rubescens DSM 1968]ODV58221.1 hypothetical protein ASCRUDRAFT_72854 [Ascoidea rubescens DSM 1968]